MKITIAATRTCPKLTLLERELQNARLSYKVVYFKEHPEIFEKYHIKNSPSLIVDGKVVSMEMNEMLDKINELKIKK